MYIYIQNLFKLIGTMAMAGGAFVTALGFYDYMLSGGKPELIKRSSVIMGVGLFAFLAGGLFISISYSNTIFQQIENPATTKTSTTTLEEEIKKILTATDIPEPKILEITGTTITSSFTAFLPDPQMMVQCDGNAYGVTNCRIGYPTYSIALNMNDPVIPKNIQTIFLGIPAIKVNNISGKYVISLGPYEKEEFAGGYYGCCTASISSCTGYETWRKIRVTYTIDYSDFVKSVPIPMQENYILSLISKGKILRYKSTETIIDEYNVDIPVSCGAPPSCGEMWCN